MSILTEAVVSHVEGERPQMKQISGMVVHVRLGLAVAIAGVTAAIGAFALAVSGAGGPQAVGLLAASVVLSAVGLWTGIWGVIRYGLFTEGCGAQTIADELHLSRFAFWAGVTSQMAFMVDLAAAIVLLVRFIV